MTAGQCRVRAVQATLAVLVTGILFTQQGAAQSTAFQRGEHVRVKAPTKASEPKKSDIVVTVVAVPNDRIRVTDSAVYVNDAAISGFSLELLGRVAHSTHTPSVVPEGQYLVMGEVWWTVEDVDQYWGVIPTTSLEMVR